MSIENLSTSLQKRGLQELPNIQIRHINALFANKQQLFAIASYSNPLELEQRWHIAAQQFAFHIQSNLPAELDELRWDMYLLLYVENGSIQAGLRKRIENNRFYFRKLVVANNEVDYVEAWLPFSTFEHFELANEHTQLYSENQFLARLKACLMPEYQSAWNEMLWEFGAINAEQLIQYLETIAPKGRDKNVD